MKIKKYTNRIFLLNAQPVENMGILFWLQKSSVQVNLSSSDSFLWYGELVMLLPNVHAVNFVRLNLIVPPDFIA